MVCKAKFCRVKRSALRQRLAALVVLAVLLVALAACGEDEPDVPPVFPNDQPTLKPLEIAGVDDPTPFVNATPTRTPVPATATPLPTVAPLPTVPPLDWTRPTADADTVMAALSGPSVDGAGEGVQRALDPLTILPARSRSGIVTYSVQPGDNLRTIAEKFGIEQNTIIWSNDRFYVNAMGVGLELNILPVDGVYHQVEDPQTITDIATTYEVDPYAIIDSEFNNLFGAAPNTILPEGVFVVVPGGTGSTEPIYWDPGIVMSTELATDGSNPIGVGINAGTDVAAFAIGDPGSCGKLAVHGGSPPNQFVPIQSRYTITQDFSWNHGGIDLAVPEGTRVYAAGGGTVIFKGWSTWGYGYTLVVAHGGTLTIYGHLNGAFVGCGQIVTPGQNIAVTGNSGRSSGPHLHFEIRGSNAAPISPWNYLSF